MTSLKRILVAAGIVAALAVPAPVMAEDIEEPSINKAIDWAVKIAYDQDYGYSQSGRWGSEGYDCSSFVISAFWKGGFDLGYDTRQEGDTADIPAAFCAAGFEWIPAEDLQLETGSIDLLKPGDILLIEGYHAEMYIGDGLTAAAHEAVPSEDHPNRSTAPGDQGDEICVYDYVWHPWTGVLRYKGKPDQKEISHEKNYEVLVDSLLVRAQPYSESLVIELLEENEQIYVSDIQGGWGYTTVRGKDGYVNMSYLRKLKTSSYKSASARKEEKEKKAQKENEGGLILTVNIDTLFMRKEPDKVSSVVCVLNKYDKLKLLSHTGDWGRVALGDLEGWVNLDYCI